MKLGSFVLDFEIGCCLLQDQTPLHPLHGHGLFPSPPLLLRRCYQTKPTRSRSTGLLDQLRTTRSTEPSAITLSHPSRSTKHHNINRTRCSQTNTQSLIHGMVEHACNVRGNMVQPYVYESSCVGPMCMMHPPMGLSPHANAEPPTKMSDAATICPNGTSFIVPAMPRALWCVQTLLQDGAQERCMLEQPRYQKGDPMGSGPSSNARVQASRLNVYETLFFIVRGDE